MNTLQDNIKRQKRLLDAIQAMTEDNYWYNEKDRRYRNSARKCLKKTVKNFKRLNVVILKQTESEIRNRHYTYFKL